MKDETVIDLVKVFICLLIFGLVAFKDIKRNILLSQTSNVCEAYIYDLDVVRRTFRYRYMFYNQGEKGVGTLTRNALFKGDFHIGDTILVRVYPSNIEVNRYCKRCLSH